MNITRQSPAMRAVVCAALATGLCLPRPGMADTPDKAAALVGAWSLNPDLSTPSRGSGAPENGGQDGGGRGGGYGGGGGRRGRGGFGGGGQRGGYGGGGASMNPEEMARRREAMRDIMNPPAHLTIVSTGTMVVVTGPDGRTTRLSTDGSKITDESTKIERKTKWDGAKLVSDISGAGGGKVTETYFVDGEHHQLHLVAEIEGRGGMPARTLTHVYDLDAR